MNLTLYQIDNFGRQTSNLAPKILYLLVLMALCEYLSLNVAGPSDSLLMNGIWQRWWGFPFEITLWKKWLLSFWHSLFLALLVSWLWERGGHLGKELSGIWPISREDLGPSSQCPQGAESLTFNRMSEYGSRLPSSTPGGTQLSL